METRAHYVLVGSFVLFMVVGLVAFVVWFGKIQFEAEAKRYEIIFRGSVTGLSPGSPVRYSGVRVGEVRVISLDEENPNKVHVIVEVQADTPIREDTIAKLEIQGLTGGLYVLLAGGSPDSPPLTIQPGEEYPVIPSRTSSLAELLEGAPELLENANALLRRLNHLANAENRARIAAILANVEETTDAVASRRKEIEAVIQDTSSTMKNVSEASQAVASLAKTIERDSAGLIKQAEDTLAAAERLANRLDGTVEANETQIAGLITDLRGTSKSITRMANQINELVAENREPINEFTTRGLINISNLITEARDFLVSLNRVTTEVERDPARFLFGDQQQGYETGQ
ncbi:MAG: MlaD family protein [Pseudomonadota bacterium]